MGIGCFDISSIRSVYIFIFPNSGWNKKFFYLKNIEMNKLSLALLNAKCGNVLTTLVSSNDSADSVKSELNTRIPDGKGIEDVNLVLDNMSEKLKSATEDFKTVIGMVNELNSVLKQLVDEKHGVVEKEKEVAEIKTELQKDLKSID